MNITNCDNVTYDLLNDLYNADRKTALFVYDRLNTEILRKQASYEDENGELTEAGELLCGLIEMVLVHGIWKRDYKCSEEGESVC